MMLGIVESTRKLREGIVNQAQLSTTHRKALVAIEDLEVPDYHCMRMLTRTTRSLSTGRPSCWQEHLIGWIQKWEWADDDLPRQQCTTWLELMIGYEVDTGQTVTHTYSLAQGPASLLVARPLLGTWSIILGGGSWICSVRTSPLMHGGFSKVSGAIPTKAI